MHFVALIGLITSIFAAIIGLRQNDIKKVLAYSTVSQLGLMFVALGMGAYASAIFHVTTHAFFKALIFPLAAVQESTRGRDVMIELLEARLQQLELEMAEQGWTRLGDSAGREFSVGGHSSSPDVSKSAPVCLPSGNVQVWPQTPQCHSERSVGESMAVTSVN
jgi:hypothetical protein